MCRFQVNIHPSPQDRVKNQLVAGLLEHLHQRGECGEEELLLVEGQNPEVILLGEVLRVLENVREHVELVQRSAIPVQDAFDEGVAVFGASHQQALCDVS